MCANPASGRGFHRCAVVPPTHLCARATSVWTTGEPAPSPRKPRSSTYVSLLQVPSVGCLPFAPWGVAVVGRAVTGRDWHTMASPQVATAIAQFEPVTVAASPALWATAYELFRPYIDASTSASTPAATSAPLHGIRVVEIDMDDSWYRDTCPTFAYSSSGSSSAGGDSEPTTGLVGVCWRFNAWGGLYTDFDKVRGCCFVAQGP